MMHWATYKKYQKRKKAEQQRIMRQNELDQIEREQQAAEQNRRDRFTQWLLVLDPAQAPPQAAQDGQRYVKEVLWVEYVRLGGPKRLHEMENFRNKYKERHRRRTMIKTFTLKNGRVKAKAPVGSIFNESGTFESFRFPKPVFSVQWKAPHSETVIHQTFIDVKVKIKSLSRGKEKGTKVDPKYDWNTVFRFGDANYAHGIPRTPKGKIDSPLVVTSHYRVEVSDLSHLTSDKPDLMAIIRLIFWFTETNQMLRTNPPRETVTWKWD